MKLDDIKIVIQQNCPEMLSSDNFMQHVINKYYNGEFVNTKTLNDEEYKVWCKLREVIGTATVGQVIKHLKENFKLTDKLCYMDCVEGCKNDCIYITKDQLGSRFFFYIKDLKKRNITNHNTTKEQEDEIYPFVNDNDVVVI